MRRNQVWVVVGILAVALGLRVAVVLAWDSFDPIADGLHFDRLATSLANGEGWGQASFPATVGGTAFRAPGYPAMLALIYAVVGDQSWTAARLVNALLGTGIVALTGVIGAQLLSHRAALLAMGIAAIHPLMIVVATPIALEPLLVVLTLAAIAATLHHRTTPHSLRWPVVAGVLLGLAVLTRELGGLVLPPLAWLCWRTAAHAMPGRARLDRRVLAAPAAMSLVAVVVVLPWTIRNAIVLDAFVPVSTSTGVGLAGTYNESSLERENTGQWMVPWNDPGMRAIIQERDWTEVGLSDALTEASIELVRDHPAYPLEVGFWNAVRMFDLDGGEYTRFITQFFPYPERLVGPSIVAGWIVLALALVGAFTRRIRGTPLAVWMIPALLSPFMVFVLPGSIRYRASLEPFFVLLASAAILAALDRTASTRERAGGRAEAV